MMMMMMKMKTRKITPIKRTQFYLNPPKVLKEMKDLREQRKDLAKENNKIRHPIKIKIFELHLIKLQILHLY